METKLKKLILLFILAALPMRMALAEEIQIQVLRLKPGQDVKVEIDAYVKAHALHAASVISAVGSLNEANIRFANKDKSTVIKGPLEVVSLSGTLGLDGDHLHIAVSDGAGKTTGGHLVEGNKVFTTMELVIGVYPSLIFKRTLDSASGYKELDIQKHQ
jgi:predicted DNA-binding protein with PD1-like motif